MDPEIIIKNNKNPLTGIAKNDLSKHLKKAQNFREVKIVYFGTPEFGARILENLLRQIENPQSQISLDMDTKSVPLKFEVQSVVTNPDKPSGRHAEALETPVAKVAAKQKLPVLKPGKLDSEFIKNHLALLEADLFLVASYGKILPRELLNIPALGALNVHGSLLPKNRGASPIQQTILNGDKTTGISIMLMDEKMDHGPLLITKKISLSNQDNYISLSTKLVQLTDSLLLPTLANFVLGKTSPKQQNHFRATYTKLIKKDSGYFDINNPPSLEVLDRMARAYYPWPGVWTRWNGKIVKFLPGKMIQMEGKKAAKLEDFLNGYPNFPLKKL